VRAESHREYAAKGHGLTQLHALVQPITRRTA